jgi:hypothetical protein
LSYFLFKSLHSSTKNMTSLTIGKFIIGISIFLLLHCLISALQHRAYLKLIERQFEGLPLDIVAECLLSVILSICGVFVTAGEFKPIKLTTIFSEKTFDMLDTRPNFMLFRHRGRAPKTQ